MAAKVNFNYTSKIIEVTQTPELEVDSGESSATGQWVVDIDVKIDIYSDGKEDWLSDPTLNKFNFPVRAIGGQELPGEKKLGTTFFLDYGWRIRPYEGNHVLRVNGNLYTEEGDSPFVQTIGSYNVMVINTVSSLVDSTVQQLAEIEFASFSGGVTVDVINGYPGTEYGDKPVGTTIYPSNNMTDALSIAVSRGLTTFYIIGDITLDSGTDFLEMNFVGESPTKSTITIDADADVENCEFYDAEIQGTLDGNNVLQNCMIGTLNYVNGFVRQCILTTGTITLGGSEEAHFLDCWSGVVGTATPTIDMGGSGQDLGLRNYNGGIQINNLTGSSKANVDLNAGHIILDSTVSSGEVVVRGVGQITDNSTGDASVNIDGLLNPDVITTRVWDEATADRQTPGTIGGDYYNLLQGFSWMNKIITNKKVLAKTGDVWELIIYDDDNVTPILRKDIKDKDGNNITDLEAGTLAQELKSDV